MAFSVNNRVKLNDAVIIPTEEYKVEIGYDATGKLAVLLRMGNMGRVASISPDKIKDLEKLLARHIMNNEPSKIFSFDGDYKIAWKALRQGIVWYFWSRPPLIYYWLEQRFGRGCNLFDIIAAFFQNRYGKTLQRLCNKTGRNLYGHWIK
jgi:hypothetical protein